MDNKNTIVKVFYNQSYSDGQTRFYTEVEEYIAEMEGNGYVLEETETQTIAHELVPNEIYVTVKMRKKKVPTGSRRFTDDEIKEIAARLSGLWRKGWKS